MPTEKPRTSILLDEFEKRKLQKLCEAYGLSMSRMIGLLIRQAKIPPNTE